MSGSSLLYGRACSLVVANAAGQGLELGAFRVRFQVRAWELSSPAQATIRISNLAPSTVALLQKEFTSVVLQAGYAGNIARIFSGTIIQALSGRENRTDTFVDVTAFDGDQAHNFAVVSTTLAAGAGPADVARAATAAMAPHGVEQGYTAPMTGPKLPRGRVLYGMARDHLRDVALAQSMVWNIQDGKVVFVPRDGYLPGQAVVLTSATGLVGLPTQTQDGIMVRCLLNPQIRPNTRIQINNASIQGAKLPVSTQDPFGKLTSQLLPKTDADGFYRVLALDFSGDTRGAEWYCDMACVALDGTVPISQAQRGRGGSASAATALPTPPVPPATPVAPPVGPAHA